MIKLENAKGEVLMLPESYKEIDAAMIDKLIESVYIAPNKALICAIVTCKLSDLGKKRNSNEGGILTSTMPFLVKTRTNNQNDAQEDIKSNSMAKAVIVTRESLIMGVHVSLKNELTSNNIRDFIQDDPKLSRDMIMSNATFKQKVGMATVAEAIAAGNAGSLSSTGGEVESNFKLITTPEVCYIEFKVIPITDIHGCFNDVDLKYLSK